MSSSRNPLSSPTALPYALVAALLVAIGVVGRWGQPDWCVTPLAAVGLLAGYTLPRRWALAVPVAAMLLSDGLLPAYGSALVALSVYAAIAVPALLGAWLRRPAASASVGAARLFGLSAAPAVLFFLSTNFAVWASQSLYPKTAVGLAECYAAALPFFRRMLLGDLAYVGILFAAAALAGAFSLRGAIEGRTADQLVSGR